MFCATVFLVLSLFMYIKCDDPRAEQGYPSGLMSVCPGSTKPATIPRSQLKYLHFVVQGATNRQKYTYWTAKNIAKDPRIDFRRATRLMRPVGKHVAEVLAILTRSGLDPTKVELLGFSLGGQTVSYIAKNFQVLTGRNISRITALEPAGPCFRTLGPTERLESTNADFVQVIHTNIDGYGMANRMGHVDFYVNGGEYQPADLNLFPCTATCSHFRVLALWAIAVRNPEKFIAIKCNTIQEARDAECYKNKQVTNVMGLDVDVKKHGIFFLSTSKSYPFYLGKAGIKKEFAAWRRISDINDSNETDIYT
ncbi:pancreatic lipase-related protein 2-like isoform X2 [Pieris brassicae]|uniref:pancreatic lipase-related protein 2-like isoform X2 n=1 Tax=Pieris brassicae TaxID=7116 RepID=UPI001E65F107|nr:pancreatic lipase-related protein 2-like isoform X2 [Pieris brassicae]